MSEEHPPGPGWLMGDDGHWKPPSFSYDPPVVRSTPDPKDEGEKKVRVKRGRTRAKNEAKRMAKTALGGVFCIVGLVGVVAAGNTVYNGVKADEARVSPIDEPDDDAAASDETLLGTPTPVLDAATVCPSSAEVAAVVAEPEQAVTYTEDERTRVNGIPLWGIRCNYGPTVHVGVERPGVAGEVLTWLKESEGDAVVSEGPFGEASTTLTDPVDAEVREAMNGAVRVVFVVSGRTFWVTVDADVADRVDGLAQLVLDRNGGVGALTAPTTTTTSTTPPTTAAPAP